MSGDRVPTDAPHPVEEASGGLLRGLGFALAIQLGGMFLLGVLVMSVWPLVGWLMELLS